MITAYVYNYHGKTDIISAYGLVEFEVLPRIGEIVYLTNDLNNGHVVEMVTHTPNGEMYKIAIYLNSEPTDNHLAKHVNAIR